MTATRRVDPAPLRVEGNAVVGQRRMEKGETGAGEHPQGSERQRGHRVLRVVWQESGRVEQHPA